MTPNLTITPATAADLPAILALNEMHVPHVSSLTTDSLQALVDQASYVSVARIGGEIAGFLLALGPDQPYESLNYRWFCQRYDDFVYIDRIAIDKHFHGQGIGRA